jgi:hypothetical protein
VEGDLDCLVTIRSGAAKGKKSAGRQWYVVAGETTLTGLPNKGDVGKAMEVLTNHSAAFVEGWLRKLAAGDTRGAFLDTQEPAERERLRAEFARLDVAQARTGTAWAGAWLAAADSAQSGALGVFLLGGVAPPSAAGTSPEGYRQFLEGAFPRRDAFRPAEEPQRTDALRPLLEQFGTNHGEFELPRVGNTPARRLSPLALWQPVPDLRARLKDLPVDEQRAVIERWMQEPDARLQMTHDYQIVLYPRGAGLRAPPRFVYDARFVLESDPGPLGIGNKPTWRIAVVELLSVMDLHKPGRPPPGRGDIPPRAEPPPELQRP